MEKREAVEELFVGVGVTPVGERVLLCVADNIEFEAVQILEHHPNGFEQDNSTYIFQWLAIVVYTQDTVRNCIVTCPVNDYI